MKAYGVVVLPFVASTSAHGMLADVLALANGSTPGQLAPAPLRRYFLLRQATQSLKLGGAALAVGGAWMVFGPGPDRHDPGWIKPACGSSKPAR